MERDPNPLIPEGKSVDNQNSQIHPKNDGGDNRQQHPAKVYTEFFRIVGRVFPVFCFLAIIEALALFLEHFAEVFHGIFVDLANWASLCLQLLVISVPIAKWVEKCGKRKGWVWIPYGFACLVMLCAIFIPNHESKPNLELLLTTSLREGDRIAVTNDFLMVKPPARWEAVRGFFEAPIVSEPANVLLVFQLKNNSPHLVEDTIEFIFTTSFSNEELDLDNSWSRVNVIDQPSMKSAFAIKTNAFLLQDDTITMPQIGLDNVTNRQTGIMEIRVRGKQIMERQYVFRFDFTTDQNIKPHFTFADVSWSNGDAIFSLPSNRLYGQNITNLK